MAFFQHIKGIQSGHQVKKSDCFTGQQDYIVAMLSEGIAFIGIVFLLNIVLDKTHISQAQMNLTMYKVKTLLCKQ